jgi:enamine deaminase RidA (YjgF/YER057c/UK114 family)
LNQQRGLDCILGRVFDGKPVSTFPENALARNTREHEPCRSCQHAPADLPRIGVLAVAALLKPEMKVEIEVTAKRRA